MENRSKEPHKLKYTANPKNGDSKNPKSRETFRGRKGDFGGGGGGRRDFWGEKGGFWGSGKMKTPMVEEGQKPKNEDPKDPKSGDQKTPKAERL